MNIQRQYEKEHPERIGETDKVFAESLYIEWLEAKVIAVQNDVIKSLPTDAEALWKAAKETVTLHHYNGDTRPPIDVDKYKTLQDYLNGNAREGN